MASGGQNEMALSELTYPQLTQISEQLTKDMNLLELALTSLTGAQGKFVECKQSLEKITPKMCEKDILVPLTSSMYVPGHLTDPEKFLIDIGTGYYIELAKEKAINYYERKVKFISDQIEKLIPTLQEKKQFKEVIMETLQLKIQAQLAAKAKTDKS